MESSETLHDIEENKNEDIQWREIIDWPSLNGGFLVEKQQQDLEAQGRRLELGLWCSLLQQRNLGFGEKLHFILDTRARGRVFT